MEAIFGVLAVLVVFFALKAIFYEESCGAWSIIALGLLSVGLVQAQQELDDQRIHCSIEEQERVDNLGVR